MAAPASAATQPPISMSVGNPPGERPVIRARTMTSGARFAKRATTSGWDVVRMATMKAKLQIQYETTHPARAVFAPRPTFCFAKWACTIVERRRNGDGGAAMPFEPSHGWPMDGKSGVVSDNACDDPLLCLANASSRMSRTVLMAAIGRAAKHAGAGGQRRYGEDDPADDGHLALDSSDQGSLHSAATLVRSLLPDGELHSRDVRWQLQANLSLQQLKGPTGTAAEGARVFFPWRHRSFQARRQQECGLGQSAFFFRIVHEERHVFLIRQLPHRRIQRPRQDGSRLEVLAGHRRFPLIRNGHDGHPWERRGLARLLLHAELLGALAKLVVGRHRREEWEEAMRQLVLRQLDLLGRLEARILVGLDWQGEEVSVGRKIVENLCKDQVRSAGQRSFWVRWTQRLKPLHLAEELVAIQSEETQLDAIVDGQVSPDSFDAEAPVLLRLLLGENPNRCARPRRWSRSRSRRIIHHAKVALLTLVESPEVDDMAKQVGLVDPIGHGQQERPREVRSPAVEGKLAPRLENAVCMRPLPALPEVEELDPHPLLRPGHGLVLPLHRGNDFLPTCANEDDGDADAGLVEC
eukprot:scaffold77_cov236-Pinguiococcus_pyrenoidosus.AAC.4